MIYTLQSDINQAREFYARVKGMVSDNGRAPEQAKVLPALILLVGADDEDAAEKMARLDSLVEPSVGFEQLRALIEMDLSGYPLDGPVPDVPETELGTKTRQKHFLGIARRNNLTVRQLMAVAARAGAIAGGPESIADHIEEWIRSDAADGFTSLSRTLPTRSISSSIT